MSSPSGERQWARQRSLSGLSWYAPTIAKTATAAMCAAPGCPPVSQPASQASP